MSQNGRFLPKLVTRFGHGHTRVIIMKGLAFGESTIMFYAIDKTTRQLICIRKITAFIVPVPVLLKGKNEYVWEK